MSRVLKRVPMNFSWPIDATWKGYINPYCATKCVACGGSGYAPEAREVYEGFHERTRRGSGITPEELRALLRRDRLYDLTRTRDGRRRKPTLDEVNAWGRDGIGHDAINRAICVRAYCEARGLTLVCPLCEGHGRYYCHPKYRRLSQRWKKIEPPLGDGYQLWEDVTEGSPKSPVFQTLRELAVWCERNATTFADFRASAKQWEVMLRNGTVHARDGNMVFV